MITEILLSIVCTAASLAFAVVGLLVIFVAIRATQLMLALQRFHRGFGVDTAVFYWLMGGLFLYISWRLWTL